MKTACPDCGNDGETERIWTDAFGRCFRTACPGGPDEAMADKGEVE